MITLQRPGQTSLGIEFVLIDFDGTLAQDGRVHPKAKDKINLLSKRAKIYILVKEEDERVGQSLRNVKAGRYFLRDGEASGQKAGLLREFGPDRCVAIGNGVDDGAMLEEAGLGICVIGKEGASAQGLAKADVVVSSVLDALDLLLKPLRHKATLGT